MASQTEIYNLALGAVGTRTSVSAPNEASVEAEQLTIHWKQTIEDLLCRHNWGFARRTVYLADAGDPQPGWAYKYAYPADCLKFRYIWKATKGGKPIPFQAAGDVDSNDNPLRVINTNKYQAIGVYTAKVMLTDAWDSGFTTALYHALGAAVALQLTGDLSVANAVANKAAEKFKIAAAADANETSREQDPLPDWIEARGYTGESDAEG